MIDFNANNYVYVKLTDTGRVAVIKHDNALREEFPYIPDDPVIEVDGWSKWQLHELMYYFGHLMTMGGNDPFEMNMKIDVDLENISKTNLQTKFETAIIDRELVSELYDDLLATRKASDVEILRNELNKIGISVSHKVTYCFWKLYSQKSYSDWLSPTIFSSSIVTAFIEGYGVFDINSD